MKVPKWANVWGSKHWMLEPASLAHHLSPATYQRVPHLDLISAELARMVVEPVYLIVECPVRHGKSTTISHWTPVWFLSLFPTRRVQLCSYEGSFAASWGRRVRNSINEHSEELGIYVAGDSSAADRWDLVTGGGMMTAGMQGGFTGKGSHLTLIDDPIKNQEEADSKTVRDKNWETFDSTLMTRMEPGGSVVVIMSRWNDDDLVARLKKYQAGKWKVIRIPALAEAGDPLGRPPGTALWPERYDEAALLEIKKWARPRTWAALYQNDPLPEEGAIFKRATFRYYEDRGDHWLCKRSKTEHMVPKDVGYRMITADLAISQDEQADYCAFGVWHVTPQRDLLKLDLIRARIPGPDQERVLEDLLRRWGASRGWIEKVQYQATLVQGLVRKGLPFQGLPVDRDKVSRGQVLASRIEMETVFFPEQAPWLTEYENELIDFRGDGSTHDDMVDESSMAAIVVGLATTPIIGRIDVQHPAPKPQNRIFRPQPKRRPMWIPPAR